MFVYSPHETKKETCNEENLRISWAVGAATVLAACTGPGPCCVQSLTPAASSTDSLPWCLANQRLSTGLGVGHRQWNVLFHSIPRICFDDIAFGYRSLRRFALALWLLDRESWTLCAPWMSTLDANLATSICCVALVTDPVDTHSDRLLDAICFPVWFVRRERFDVDGEPFRQLLIPLRFNL
jgi:hypothetical protein